MAMILRRDSGALESLPLKLIIVAVVATMSVIPAGKALEGMEMKAFLTEANRQLDRIATGAQIVAIEGPGSSRLFDLDFSSHCKLTFAKLEIGDAENGSRMSTIALELTNGAHLVRVVEDPPVWLIGPEGTGLAVFSSEFDLRLTMSIRDPGPCVLAEVV